MPVNVVKAGFDLGSVVVVVGTLVDALPKIAAGFSVAWYVYCMAKEVIRLYKERK